MRVALLLLVLALVVAIGDRCAAAPPAKVFQLSASEPAVPVIEWGEAFNATITNWDPARYRLARVQTEERVIWDGITVTGDIEVEPGKITLRAYSSTPELRISVYWQTADELLLQRSSVVLHVSCNSNLPQCYTLPADMRSDPFAPPVSSLSKRRRPVASAVHSFRNPDTRLLFGLQIVGGVVLSVILASLVTGAVLVLAQRNKRRRRAIYHTTGFDGEAHGSRRPAPPPEDRRVAANAFRVTGV